MQEEPEKTPEELETERLKAVEEELLGKVSSAASKDLPDVPEWEFERPPQPKYDGGFNVSGKGMAMGIGVLYSLVVPSVGGLLIGWYADSRLGTGTQWMIIGFMMGIVAGFAMMFRLIAKLGKED